MREGFGTWLIRACKYTLSHVINMVEWVLYSPCLSAKGRFLLNIDLYHLLYAVIQRCLIKDRCCAVRNIFLHKMSESAFYGQIGAFFLGFVSTVTCTVTCCWNLWSISSDGDSASVLGAIWGFNGIWIECIQHTSGAFQCDSYGTAVFNLPSKYYIFKQT